MKQFLQKWLVLVLIVPVVVSGCAIFSLKKQDIKGKIELAQGHIESLKNLGADKLFESDFKEAEKFFAQAEESWEKRNFPGHLAKALEYADKSLDSCKKIQNNYDAYVKDIEDKIKKAHNYVELLEIANIERLYPADFKLAKESLASAEENYKSARLKEALSDADESLKIFKQLKDDLTEYMGTLIGNTIQDIEIIKENDPENPIVRELPELKKKQENVKKMKTGEMLASLNQVINDYKEVLEIIDRVKGTESIELESDAFFKKGKYKLSEDGKDKLSQFLEEKMNAEVVYFVKKHPESIVEIKVVGYTDELGFRGRRLVRELVRGREGEVPEGKVERKIFLNQRLSKFRAETIGDYVKGVILENVQGLAESDFDMDIIGKGEELPPGIKRLKNPDDKRRRICKLYISFKSSR